MEMRKAQGKNYGVFLAKHPDPEHTVDFYKQVYSCCYSANANEVNYDAMKELLDAYRDQELTDECLNWARSFDEQQETIIKNVSQQVENNKEKIKRQPTEHIKPTDIQLTRVSDCEEKDTEWLFTNTVPVGDITILAGDGGTGKTLIWNSIAGAVSCGGKAFFEPVPDEFAKGREPGTVIYFSSEDSTEHTLRKRLRLAGADLDNIYFLDLKEEKFKDIKFNSELLREIIEKYKPKLVIFDPLQSFLPPEMQMGSRNAMRNALNPLIGLGEKTRTTFLIVVHTNKRQGVFGRNRVADSADIWDIARSVLIVGKTNDDQRYLSQEKSNYGKLADTAIFKINDEGQAEMLGFSNKKDADFVHERDQIIRQAPQREDAKEFILDTLEEGKMSVKELKERAYATGITPATLKRAKQDLTNAGAIKTWSEGFNPKVYYIALKEKNKNTS